MNTVEKRPRRAVIVTALPVEYEAVRAHIRQPRQVVHPAGTIYETGAYGETPNEWEVSLVEIGQGNERSAFEAERAIQFFQPRVVLFVGIAGGIKDVALGDVVAATKIYGYEYGKADGAFLPRPEIGQGTYVMEQRARSEAKRPDWYSLIVNGGQEGTPRAFAGAMAAGSKVVASARSAVCRFLRKQYSDALAVEMEGAGFLVATRANPQVDSLVVRGISDLLDDKSESDKQGWQAIAAQRASAFAFHVLGTLDGRDSFVLGRVALEKTALSAPHEAATFTARTLADLASEDDALVRAYRDTVDFPEQMYIAGYYKPNHCFGGLPRSEQLRLKRTLKSHPASAIEPVRRDIALLKAFARNGQPCLLHYYSGKRATGWNTWLLLHVSRDLQAGSFAIADHMAAARAELATFIGLDPSQVSMDYVRSLPVSVCLKLNRYAKVPALRARPKIYLFRYAFITLSQVPEHLLTEQFAMRLGSHVRIFRWFYSEEMESLNNGRTWNVNADVIKTLYDVFGTLLVGLPDGLAGSRLRF